VSEIKEVKFMRNRVTKDIEEVENILRESKPLLAERFNVSEIGIFGCYLRKVQKTRSDLDILVGFSEPIGLFAFMELEDYLAKKLGVKVDLVMKDALKARIKERVMKEVLYV
jgi:hypothetical protein